MKTDDVQQFFADRGLPFHWLDAAGSPMKAIPDQMPAMSVDVAIVTPDVHLGVGRGDVFQETDASRVPRLLKFIAVQAALRDELPGRFAAVQLGDFFDVMRSNNPAGSFGSRLQAIFNAYPEVVRAASQLPLLHCIGNHDHELYDNRAMLPGLGINAHIVRALGPGVLAFHGNDFVSLRDIELSVQYQTWLLSLVQSLQEMPILAPLVDLMQRIADSSLADPFLGSSRANPWPSPPRGQAFPQGWSAPWIVRDDAAQLGEPLLDWENRVAKELFVGILGHSHRPGIGWTQIEVNRRIPLVDVGSWTFGRTNFAVVGADGIGVAELD